jgi:4-alpha-glucanotransferase
LARLYGVQTAYYDVERQRRQAAPEMLLHVLRALGAPVARLADVPAAVRERRAAPWQRGVEPVTVLWTGGAAALELRRPATAAGTDLRCDVALEDGDTRRWHVAGPDLHATGAAEVEGARYVAQRVPLSDDLPEGYHRLQVTAGKQRFDTLLIRAPRRAHAPARGRGRGSGWGVFLPLYALRSARDWGSGDFTDLGALIGWVGAQGGDVVATLPLLAAFLDEPFEPSPYAPASRLFWNELFVDPERAPELARTPAAQALLRSPALQAERAALRDEPLVAYERVAALKRRVLLELARGFFAEGETPPAAYRRFVVEHPQLEDYACFRAAGERYGGPWPTWPESPREGTLGQGDYDPEAKRYHLYAQWLAHQHLDAVAARTRASGTRLYLDLPLGVHPDSYDVWREREAFATSIAGGAPPDVFFRGGQNWGFPPLHPERMRERGYQYFRASIQNHLQHAGMLRIDHVMGLHRLYWVPQGAAATEGVYVRYPAEELYAVLCLESRRHRAVLVGEDLGTVPRAVRTAMGRHGLRRMYVGQFELAPNADAPFRPVARGTVASLNTHDMYPWAAFWRALDVPDRQALGLLDDSLAAHEGGWRDGLRHALLSHLERQPGGAAGWDWAGAAAADGEGESAERAARNALLAHLAASAADVTLVNLEDLWLETRPQNVPGTWRERPNWRRKARYPLEAFTRLPAVCEPLRQIDSLRGTRRGDHA